jgi:hypothetical protein
VIKHLRVRKELWNLSPGAERQPRQLDDPHYFRKVNALYHEFEEVGLNKQLGYACPADLVELFPQFYWKCISPQSNTSMSHRADGSGLPICIAMSFAPRSASICPGQSTRRATSTRLVRRNSHCISAFRQRNIAEPPCRLQSSLRIFCPVICLNYLPPATDLEICDLGTRGVIFASANLDFC